MAKFEGNYPKKPSEAPAWFASFYENYALVIKFLNQIGRGGLNLTENVLNTPFSASVKHGQTLKIPHSLGVIPVSISIQGGRVESYSIDSKDNKLITSTVRLLNSPVTDTATFNAISSVNVLDASLFKIGDSVIIQGQNRVIISIVGNRIGLDVAILLQPPCVLTLNTELLTFVIF